MQTKTITDQDRALIHARKIVQAHNYVALDTETTGPQKDEDQPVSYAVVGPELQTIGQGFIKPTIPITQGAFDVHGISDKHLEFAPTFDKVWPCLLSLLTGRDVLIYNAAYDLGVIGVLAKVYGINTSAAGLKTTCIMLLYAQYHGELGKYGRGYTWKKLDVACDAFGIKRQNAHDAAVDARDTIKVLHAMAQLADELGL